ncbi:MAG: YcgL domain-containing protein [Solidesulfovibrio sp. DCME]|uniref:YcgL domain-containing protein n=1 Tax=Solidesulfovibrio sp. DCME TaxID=3447380 RepID=UPI003D0A0445
MPFAIHQSKTNHKMYLFTRRKNDLSCVPEGVLEELGKIKFLRNSFPQEKETEKISPYYKEIENFVSAKGYFVLKLE